jgi:NAD(P)-dependent dehydrogenase (short-subunit alcohol dehydrogenase family)
VTGGAGGIGKLVVRHLLDSGAGRIVLASRRAAVDPALGNADRVAAVHCDLADERAVTALVDQLSRQGPPLRGVFHLAGATADGLLARHAPLAMEPAFAAKLDGAWLLDRATRRLELDHFVLFGSVTAAIGLAGAGAYAAANAALDGIARERQRAGLPGLSIGWAAWRGIGMAEVTQLWRDSPIPSYAPAAALEALDRALQLPMPTVVVLPADAGALLARPASDRAG